MPYTLHYKLCICISQEKVCIIHLFSGLHKIEEGILVDLTREQILAIVSRIEMKLNEKHIPKLTFYKESGVAGPTFSQWRTGLRNPSIQSLEMVAKYLDVPLDWILTGESKEIDEAVEILEVLRNRPEMRLLFSVGKDAPASVIMESAAIIMKYKEGKK